MNAITAVIFDLDGTLVDSAPGILGSMGMALEQHGLTPARALDNDLIGPPLMPTLRALTGLEDVDALAASFKAHYDTAGYQKTIAFAGIVDMLEGLRQAHWPLYIATNKRLRPTQAIMAMLGWEKFFDGIYALDSPTPAAANKAALLQHVMQRHTLAPQHTLYVGDRNDDARAAEAAQTQFFHASWGFESAASTAGAGNLDGLRRLLQSHRKATP